MNMLRVAMGSQKAMEDIVNDYSDMLYRLAFRLLEDPDAASDAVQETFMKVWQKPALYNPRYSLAVWLYRITYNVALDYLRHLKIRRQASSMLCCDAFASQPDELLVAHETSELLRESMSHLSYMQRTVFFLREVEDLSYKQIMQVTGASYDTVKSNYYLAKKYIKLWITNNT